MVHGSDSPESAAREVALFFPDLSERARRAADPRLALAPAAGDPRAARASSSRSRSRRRGARAPGRPTRSRSRTPTARRRRVAAGAREALVLGVDTIVCARRPGSTASRATAPSAREMLRRSGGPSPRGDQRHLPDRGRAGADARPHARWSSSGASTSRCIAWYLASGSGASAPAATRSRDAARRWWRDRGRLPERRRAAGGHAARARPAWRLLAWRRPAACCASDVFPAIFRDLLGHSGTRSADVRSIHSPAGRSGSQGVGP